MPDRRKVSGEVIGIAGRKQFIDKRIPGSGAFVKELRSSMGCSCVDVKMPTYRLTRCRHAAGQCSVQPYRKRLA